jgi:hypothetical protein
VFVREREEVQEVPWAVNLLLVVSLALVEAAGRLLVEAERVHVELFDPHLHLLDSVADARVDPFGLAIVHAGPHGVGVRQQLGRAPLR